MIQDDAALVKRVLSGEKSAFGPLIDRHWPRAMRLALRTLGDVADAEDVVQDAFLQALLSLRSLRAQDPFGPWLLGIVSNLCRMHWRAQRNGQALKDGERWITVPFLGTDSQPSPEVLYEAWESYNAVMAALVMLPVEQQQAVRLHYLKGLTLGEIGLLTGASAGAIKVQLHRARARLRLALLGEFAEPREPRPRVEEEFYMIETTVQEVGSSDGEGIRLPLLPTRDCIVFPHMVMPLFVGRRKSIRAIEEAVAKNKLVFLAAQRDATVNDPRIEDLHSVGTIASVVQLLHLPDGTMKILVEGKRRGRILRHIEPVDFFKVEIEEIEVVGPTGHVTAIEIDAELAVRARYNLGNLSQVEVIHADGGEYDPGPVNAILVNAGATHPRPLWLDRLLPGGRLILPLTVTTLPGSTGQILKVTRTERGYAARFISRTAIFPCIGARELETDRRLWEAFAKGGWELVRSLRRDQHEPDSTCWLHSNDFCLSIIE